MSEGIPGAGSGAARVNALTDGIGATVILDSVLGALLPALADAAAPGGRIVIGGLLASDEIRLPVWPVLIKGLRLEGFVGFLAVEADPARLAAFEAYVLAGLASGALAPTIDRAFDCEDIAAAQTYMEAGRQVGRIVVRAGA